MANYRQTVLTAFQQVEDNLAALRVLENEAQAEDEAVKAAQNSLDISTYQYKAGTVNYLTVITEQAILLQDQVQALSILTRRMSASVLLDRSPGRRMGCFDSAHPARGGTGQVGGRKGGLPADPGP